MPNDDYKVVRLLQFSASERFDYKVLVYSLKLNVWQNVEQDFPYCFHRVCCNAPLSHSVYVRGAIHLSVIRKDDQDSNHVIVAFDVASQSFRLVPQPDYPPLYYMSIDVGLLGGYLCMVGIPEHDIDYVDIWVMEKYGVKESWRKLLSISDMRYMPCVRPLVSLNNGKVVLLEVNHDEFLLYDLEKKKSKEISIRRPHTGAAVTLTELGEYTRAASMLEDLTKMKPSDPEPYRVLGAVKYELKDYEGSVATYYVASMTDVAQRLEGSGSRLDQGHHYNCLVLMEFMARMPDEKCRSEVRRIRVEAGSESSLQLSRARGIHGEDARQKSLPSTFFIFLIAKLVSNGL
ncbi:F-box domain-containing protein [Artemisia annua]|uniref:F-box domain-containing protein n=1 Tax=Artemisia annua TaxID=35608 RepID=A0A2U1KZQ9_ARTAN|nr:F-box domain-containing protein [Artemisia annua]